MSVKQLVRYPINLDEAWSTVLSYLQASPSDPDSAFRYPSVATKALAGNPVQRTVVLREFTPDGRLLFYTDQRSKKVLQLRHSHELQLHFYDHAIRLQLLVTGTAILHTGNELAEKHWNESGSKHAESYTSLKKPGERLSDPEQAHEYNEPNPENFCVVEVEPRQMEFLQLRKEGHLRSCWRLDREEGGRYWIAP